MSRPKRQATSKIVSRKREANVSNSSGFLVWERYWFGPVAAVRPYLLMKAVLLVLAFDVLLLRIIGGWSYSVDGFNVAHFQWLDTLQPMPTPGLYVGVQLAVGVLALVSVFVDTGLWIRILLVLLYSYSWATTMRDNYQHHYFLSLALITFVFFPSIRTGGLDGGVRKPPLEEKTSDLGQRTVSAWAYVLLGVNVAIVYLFTAVNKMEPGWRAGAIIQRLAKPKQILHPLEDWFAAMGISGESFWQSMAVGVVAVEVFIAASYLLAPTQDQRQSRWRRTLLWSATIAVVVFNWIGNELVLSLGIGWFSYYMVLFACVYFLPPSLLFAAGKILTFPARKLTSLRASLAASLSGAPKLSSALFAAGSLAIIIFVAAAGVAIDLPGAANVGFLVALILSVMLVLALTWRGFEGAMRYIPAAGLAMAVLWTTIAVSTIRFTFYDSYATYLKRRRADAAADISSKAARYRPTSAMPPNDRLPTTTGGSNQD